MFPFSPFILAFCGFISCHVCLLTLHSLSFLHSHLSFPFILAFWAFISFYFNSLGFLSFLPFHPSFPFIFAFSPSHPLIPCIFAFCGFISFQFVLLTFHFALLGFHFLSFLPSHPSFPFICPFSALRRVCEDFFQKTCNGLSQKNC